VLLNAKPFHTSITVSWSHAAIVCLFTFVWPYTSVWAYSAENTSVLDRKITVHLTNVTLDAALDAVAELADCSFSYSNTMLTTTRRVSVHYQNTPLREILTDVLKEELGSIQVQGNTVLLIAAAGQIKGTLYTQAGTPMPYATVRIDGTRIGTVSAQDGTYSFKIPNAGAYTVVATAVGYNMLRQTVDLSPGQILTINLTLQEASVHMNEVLVTAERTLASTATRMQTPTKDLPIPVLVIDGKQLEMMGSRRLNEVLQEQTGLALTTDPSGASNAQGLQIQGFDAAYTMIMIDGQPVIGRNSVGILDLSRMTVANIERIEIVKGTSSALYGSDALAGVVNIITRQHSLNTIHGTTTLRYGSYNTLDATADAAVPLLNKRAAAALSTNYYRTDGFDSDTGNPGKSMPPFHSYTIKGSTTAQLTPATNLNSALRYALRSQHNRYNLARDGNREDTNREEDISASAILRSKIIPHTDIQAQYYYTQYTAQSASIRINDITRERTPITENQFKQYFHRVETFANHDVSTNFKVTTGLGANVDMLDASRYNNRRSMENAFAYLQTYSTPSEKWGILAGLRYDIHNIYGRQLSPRLGIRYTPTDWIILKASAGTGFKAPSFQQLYLSFVNTTAMYSILGAAVFTEEIARLQQANEIEYIYPVAQQIGNLKAERSASVNAGFILTPVKPVTIEVNTFYNNINNMIFQELVAIKRINNGTTPGGSAQLYSYRNIERAFTQGTETNVRYAIRKGIEISAGHQWLIAKDKGIVDAIRAGRLQVRDSRGQSRYAETSDYFNLSFRSRQMINMKLFVTSERLGASASLRANYRGKYGIDDRNYENRFIDPYDLYAKGYVLLNATLEKKLLKQQLSLQLICDNLTNYRDILIPNLQPRQFIISASWKFEKKVYE